MMESIFTRTELLIGKEKLEKLKQSNIAVFGLGGVGSYAAEAVARAGVGRLTVVDMDTVNSTNINRQLCALNSTIGMKKTDVVYERLKDINPGAEVISRFCFYSNETADLFKLKEFDYIIDAIDTVSSKLLLIENAKKADIPIISSMGAGNRTDPLKLTVGDIYQTSICPLARIMRHELRKRNIDSLNVVYSKEEPVKINSGNSKTIGSISFVPSVAGLLCASEAVRALTQNL